MACDEVVLQGPVAERKGNDERHRKRSRGRSRLTDSRAPEQARTVRV